MARTSPFLDGRVRLGATYFDARLKDEIFTYFGGPGLPSACPTPPGEQHRLQPRVQVQAERRRAVGATSPSRPSARPGSYTDLDAKENGLEEIRTRAAIGSANLTWKPGRPAPPEPQRPLQRPPAGLELLAASAAPFHVAARA